MREQPRQQKRFDTQQEVLDAIETAKGRAAQHLVDAEAFDKLKMDAAGHAHELEETGADAASAEFWRDQMEEFKLKAAKKRQSYNTIVNVKLKALGDKLAEMKTEPMSFLGGDESVTR